MCIRDSNTAIQFNDKSTGTKTPIKKWTWDFRDGMQSSLKSPSSIEVSLEIRMLGRAAEEVGPKECLIF